MNNVKKEFLTFFQNKAYMLLLTLVAVGCYGFKIMHPAIGIDDTPYNYYFSDGLIVVVGRWVIFLLNKFLHIGEYSPFLTDFAGMLLLILAAILWSIVFKRMFTDALPSWCYLVFSCVFISNPLICEVFTYFLHNGIAMGYTFSALALLCFMDTLETPRKPLPYILSISFIWIAIGCYESFAVVFLVMSIFILFTGRICGKKHHPILSLMKICAILVGAVILRSLITQVLISVFSLQGLVDEAKQRSLTELLGWFLNEEGRMALSMALKRAYVMYGVFAYHYLPIAVYVLSSLLVLICSVWKSIRRKDPWIFIYMIGIFISSWILIFIEGKVTLYRSCQFLPLFCAAGILLFLYVCRFFLQKKIRFAAYILSFILIWNQTADMNSWFYIDYLKYEDAKDTMNNIALEIKKNHDITKPLIFIGIYDPPMEIVEKAYVDIYSEKYYKMLRLTFPIDQHLLEKFYFRNALQVAQTPTLSVIRWGLEAFDSNQELIQFLHMHGHQFNGVNDVNLIRSYSVSHADMPAWPKEGSIAETEDYIIINFGY